MVFGFFRIDYDIRQPHSRLCVFASATGILFGHLQGSERLVVVDPYGKVHNPTRHLDGVRAEDLKLRLADFDVASLPDAKAIAQDREAAHQKTKAAPKPARPKVPEVAAEFNKAAKAPPSPEPAPMPTPTPAPPTPPQPDHAARINLNSAVETRS